MDRSSSKRGAGGLMAPRKSYRATPFKDAGTERDQNAQFCNRIGCNGRLKCTQNTKIGNLDRSKCYKPSCSSNQIETTVKSSRSSSLTTNAKKSCLASKRKMSSLVKTDPSKSVLSSEPETPELVSSPSGYQAESMSKRKEVNLTNGGSSNASSSVAPRKILRHKPNQNTSSPSFVPSASRSSALGPYNRSSGIRSGMRNLKCNSVTDVTPSCSPLESESVRKNVTKKRSSEGESSNLPHRGRRITPRPPMDRHTSPTSSNGVSISDSVRSSSSSASGGDSSNPGSIWARRSMNTNSRMRFSGVQNGKRNSSSVREPRISFSQIRDNERPSSGSRSYSLSSIDDDNQSSRMPFASSVSGLTHLMDHDVLERYNVVGISEALLALERMGQDADLTREQMVALEASLFLSGLNLYDQHRDMRLDIDNMSYEELLALEERMGTVSTALSEEALSKCLRRRTYQATPSNVQITGSSSEDGDDAKCTICQEEFVNGDEIGELAECEHGYHATCINQWLQLKNWCPICKASAEPSQSLSPSWSL